MTTTSSSPTSPVLNTDLSLNAENSAFYGEPSFSSFEDPKKKDTPQPSPALDTIMVDTKPSSPVGANPQDPAASTVAIDVPITPVSATADPTSPVRATAQSTVLSISTTYTEEEDEDMEMIEDEETPVNAAAQSNSNAAADEGNAHRNTIEELQASLDESLQEKQSMDYELSRTRGAYHDLRNQFMDLQEKLAKKDRDYEIMSKNYLEHVRIIKATDDDHYTIRDRLIQLKASIEHLIRKAQGGRSVNLNKEAAVEHLKSSGLMDDFPVPEDKLESYHLNLYMESVVMSTLVSHFFDKPLSCIFDYNKGFKEIYDWMQVRNGKLAVRWRQQLCKMLADDPATKPRQEEEVLTASSALSELVSKVYANTNELNKIRDICNKAFELAIAMNGIESAIKPVTVPLGAAFDEENMGTSLKSNPDGKVALVIFPAFKDKESAFNVMPKVWCY
ncbi:hypothetical protein BGZ58_008250 [Dissophora ornata]|nr:hypothetical protein BGZ58_008250 [Dissophora ornata]